MPPKRQKYDFFATATFSQHFNVSKWLRVWLSKRQAYYLWRAWLIINSLLGPKPNVGFAGLELIHTFGGISAPHYNRFHSSNPRSTRKNDTMFSYPKGTQLINGGLDWLSNSLQGPKPNVGFAGFELIFNLQLPKHKNLIRRLVAKMSPSRKNRTFGVLGALGLRSRLFPRAVVLETFSFTQYLEMLLVCSMVGVDTSGLWPLLKLSFKLQMSIEHHNHGTKIVIFPRVLWVVASGWSMLCNSHSFITSFHQ